MVLAAPMPSLVQAQQVVSPASPLVFDQVTVIDVVQGKRLPEQRVVVAGNRIAAVGSATAVPVPPGAQVVDARHKYLIPGLWDMHVHPDRTEGSFYPLLIANGVTGIRDASSTLALDSLLGLRRAVLNGTLIGPPHQLFVGKALGEAAYMGQPCIRNNEGIAMCVADSADAKHVVDSLKAAGADMLKFYFLDTLYFVMAAEARRLGIPFGGHLNTNGPLPWPVGPSATEASDSGVTIIDHLPSSGGLDQYCVTHDASFERCRSLAERFRRNGTWFVPTLTIMARQPELFKKWGGGARSLAISARLLERTKQFWAGASVPGSWLRGLTEASGHAVDSVGMMRLMQRAGFPVVSGTDTGPGDAVEAMAPGFGLHAELAMYVAEGLTPVAALQSATINPAELLHATDSLGTIAPGKLADLVLLDDDPLADITNVTLVRAVVANGRFFNRAALDALLADARGKAKRRP